MSNETDKKIEAFTAKMGMLSAMLNLKFETGANFTEKDQQKFQKTMTDALTDLVVPEGIENYKAKDFEEFQLETIVAGIKKKLFFSVSHACGNNSNYCFEIGKRKFRENFESKLLGRLKADGLIIEIQGEGEEKVWNISWTS